VPGCRYKSRSQQSTLTALGITVPEFVRTAAGVDVGIAAGGLDSDMRGSDDEIDDATDEENGDDGSWETVASDEEMDGQRVSPTKLILSYFKKKSYCYPH
jgi:hypothetical protein